MLVNGGKSSAEKACKMSKKRQKGNLIHPWGLEVGGVKVFSRDKGEGRSDM